LFSKVLTKDSVSVTVDAVMYFRIFNPTRSVNKVANAKYSASLLASTTLRNILGTKSLQEILTDKESIAHRMKEVLDV
jgi:erythrocyte band 7 integral membrane protein